MKPFVPYFLLSTLVPKYTGLLTFSKPNCRVLHPLPRVNEIHVDVDANPKAYYFQQAQNGVYARQALIASILGLK